MKQQWLWCSYCTRCFNVFLTRDWGEEFNPTELEMQFGSEIDGEVWVECPYDDCHGNPLGFWPWDKYRKDNPSAEVDEVPEVGKLYPMHRLSSQTDFDNSTDGDHDRLYR